MGKRNSNGPEDVYVWGPEGEPSDAHVTHHTRLIANHSANRTEKSLVERARRGDPSWE
jgi:hypothetical protein